MVKLKFKKKKFLLLQNESKLHLLVFFSQLLKPNLNIYCKIAANVKSD